MVGGRVVLRAVPADVTCRPALVAGESVAGSRVVVVVKVIVAVEL